MILNRFRYLIRQFTKNRHISTAPVLSLKDFMPKKVTDTAECIANLAPPYVVRGEQRKRVYIETYGCQMNFNDTEIVMGILNASDCFIMVKTPEESDIILVMTCAIRENAEEKVWNRLDFLRSFERKLGRSMIVGVLGCMAERLKQEILEKRRNVDIVCGPDSYRDLPNLLQIAETGQNGINVMLSVDETYSDVTPVRLDSSTKSAFISIMRGCNNMCAFCIVPFTR